MLGAQPVRPIDLAAFYAAIANEGMHPQPHVIDSIERDGQVVYRHDPNSSVAISSVDHAAFYQLKTMMQGVVARGTAHAISALSPYVAGKTGTSEDENDAWFVGFSNDVTVAVWLGYDNAGGERRTLGGGATGGAVAAPIFAQVMESVWADGIAPKTALAAPSPEAQAQLACGSGEPESNARRRRGTSPGDSLGDSLGDCLRVDEKGRVIDARYRLVSRRSAYAERQRERNDSPSGPPEPFNPWDRRERAFAWPGFRSVPMPQPGFNGNRRESFRPPDAWQRDPGSDWEGESDERGREPPGWRSQRPSGPGFWGGGPFD
jgi:membrane peptidoglycan carboxypeptidase